MKLLKFLFSAFSDKEGGARATGTLVAAVSACWFLFVTQAEYRQQVATYNSQLAILWRQLHLTQDILASHGIYVPRETEETATNSIP